jgi:hypothetical protein
MLDALFGVFFKQKEHPLTGSLPDYVISQEEIRRAWKQPDVDQNNQNFSDPKETIFKDLNGNTTEETARLSSISDPHES